MQQNPQEAKKRYANDPEVDAFLREMGAVMSEHFFELAKKQNQKKSSESQNQVTIPAVKEIGPLEADLIRRQKEAPEIVQKEIEAVDETRVKEVLEDPELRSMLMDSELQRILQECNDPVRFQYYMRDPIISKKIRKLFKAGLVGTAK